MGNNRNSCGRVSGYWRIENDGFGFGLVKGEWRSVNN